MPESALPLFLTSQPGQLTCSLLVALLIIYGLTNLSLTLLHLEVLPPRLLSRHR